MGKLRTCNLRARKALRGKRFCYGMLYPYQREMVRTLILRWRKSSPFAQAWWGMPDTVINGQMYDFKVGAPRD